MDISDISRNENGGYVQVVVTNTGNIAAKLVRTQQSLSSSPITEEQLRSGKDITKKVVIMPGKKKGHCFGTVIIISIFRCISPV